MEKQVVFICRTCQHYNRLELGSDNYILREIDFLSLTDAFEHLFNNKNHQIEAIIESE